MEYGNFMDIISVHYKDIRKLFVSRASNKGLTFSDDAFNDAFIKCSKQFGNDCITYDDAIKYFWVAFSNTVKGERASMSKVVLCDKFDDSIDEDDCDEFAKYFYDTTMAAIVEAYGRDDMMIYSLYKYNGWSKKDLIDAGYNCNNFEIRINKIHKFVKDYTKQRINNKHNKYKKS
mgnify:CR=1 FL=1